MEETIFLSSYVIVSQAQIKSLTSSWYKTIKSHDYTWGWWSKAKYNKKTTVTKPSAAKLEREATLELKRWPTVPQLYHYILFYTTTTHGFGHYLSQQDIFWGQIEVKHAAHFFCHRLTIHIFWKQVIKSPMSAYFHIITPILRWIAHWPISTSKTGMGVLLNIIHYM